MIFTKSPEYYDDIEWCYLCKLISSNNKLCKYCIKKRDKLFNIKMDEYENTLEYKFRCWLSDLIDPKGPRYRSTHAWLIK